MERNPLIKDSRTSFSLSQSSMIRSKCSSNACSPYQRILSKANVSSTLLPAFIRPKDPSLSTSQVSRAKSQFNFQSDSEILSYIESAKSPLVNLIKVGKIELSQIDLKSLISGKTTQKAINSILTIAKYLNTRSLKEGQSVKKVLIAKTNFTKKVFNNEPTDNEIDLFSAGILICPIFIGYWTVLTFDSRELVVNYFDPMSNPVYLKQILKNFYIFLRKQKKNPGITSSLKSLVYQKVAITENFTEDESEVFMLQLILNLATGCTSYVEKAEINKYRAGFLKLIFKFGNM